MDLPTPESTDSLPPAAVIHSRIAELLTELAEVESAAGRPPGSVRVVAVTKTHPIRAMLNAIHAGLADLGENRVQEMVPKMEQVRSMGVLTPKGERPRFHMIGHLQTNKARHVVAAGVDLVHSVDSLDLARELSRRAIAANRVQDILIQVNISGEDTKHGAEPGAVAPLVEAILRDHSGVRIRGYMTMAPFEIEPEQTRPVFAGLRELAARLNAEFGGAPGYEATHLSMGMTNDWRQAVDEGATLVRIGSALFGPR